MSEAVYDRLARELNGSAAVALPANGQTDVPDSAQHIPQRIAMRCAWHQPALRTVNLAELFNLNIPPRRYLLEPWLPERGLSMVYAPRGVGKTFFALSVAYAVAAGGSFLRFQAPEARRVLYIDGEMPAETMRARLAAIERGSAQKANPDRLNLLFSDLNDGPMPDLGAFEGQRALTPYVEAADLIIVDNISTLIRTGAESESDSWRPVQEWALEQRRSGRSVLFIHHANKMGFQRGTSKREDVLDSVLSLSRPADYAAGEGARFIVTFEKARGFFGAAADPIEACYGVTNDVAQWTFGDVTDPVRDEAFQLFEKGLSVRRVAEQTGMSKSSAHRLRKEWERKSATTKPVPASQPLAGRELGQHEPPRHGQVDNFAKGGNSSGSSE